MDKNTVSKIKEEILGLPLIQDKLMKIEEKIWGKFSIGFLAVFLFFIYASKEYIIFFFNLYDGYLMWLLCFCISSLLSLLFSVVFVGFTSKIFHNLFRGKSFQRDYASFNSLFDLNEINSLFLTKKDISFIKSLFFDIDTNRVNIYQKEFKKINSEETLNQKTLIVLIESFLKDDNITYDNFSSYIKCVQSESLNLEEFLKSTFGFFLGGINKNDFIENKLNILNLVNLIKNPKVKEIIFNLYIEYESHTFKHIDIQAKINAKLKESKQYKAKSKIISI